MTQTIEITVSPTGKTKVETRGFTGSTCQAASRALEESLGLRQSESPTAEAFHSQSAEEVRAAQG